MSEKADKYMNEIPFDETCENFCNYIEDLKEKIDELTKHKASDRCLSVLEELELENEILRKENMSLKKVLTEITKENKGYRDTVDRFRAAIEKYERSLEG